MCFSSLIVAVVGCTTLIAFGLMAMFPSSLLNYFTFTVPFLALQNLYTGGIITVVLGATSIAAAACTSKRLCSSVLIAISIATGGAGGALVLLGAFFGLISKSSASPTKEKVN